MRKEHETETPILTRAVRGVNSDGFITMVQPTARAGATFQALGEMMSLANERHYVTLNSVPHVYRIVPRNAVNV